MGRSITHVIKGVRDTLMGVGQPQFDIPRIARALRSPGIDPRTWLTTATVGVRNENGDFITDDPEGIYADRLGAVVSVRLEPSEQIVTAHWSGVSVGRFGVLLFPLRPGDDVLVAIPDGDPNSDGIEVVGAKADQTALIPQDWNNDRVLLSTVVPIEIRGPAVKIDSPNLGLNGRKVNRGPEDI